MTVDEALRRIEERARETIEAVRVMVVPKGGFLLNTDCARDAVRLCRALREAVAGLSKEAYREGTGPVENSWDSPWSAREARETLARVARLLAGEEE